MRKIILVACMGMIIFACGNKKKTASAQTNAAATVATTDPANTYVLLTGVLKWKDPSLTPFNDRNRKDEELYRLFLKQGIPSANIIYLKDEQATIDAMQTGMDALLQKTGNGSRFIFYYAGHGVRDGNGPVSFANYDYDGNKDNGFLASTLSEKLNRSFKGNSVMLLADCCFSGALMDEGKAIAGNDRPVIVFSSSSSSNVSTANWTFTQTLLDCMNGETICDRNSDAVISLAEVKGELFDAMKFRERQLSGTVFYNIKDSEPFAAVSSKGTTATKSSVTSYLYFLQGNQYEPARVLTSTEYSITGQLYHYSDKLNTTVDANNTKPISFMEYPVGKKVQVEWNGSNYPAEILQTNNGFHLVRYTGYDESWDEWVMYDRIVTAEQKPCSVEWQGQWYPGELLQQKDGKYFIRYKGYSSDWDEWVGKERIRL